VRCVGTLALGLSLACGSEATEAATPARAGGAAPGADVVEGSDDLLARARASIRDGRVDPELVAELVASDDPAHARAARLLAAFDGELPAIDDDAVGDVAAGAPGDDDVPRVQVSDATATPPPVDAPSDGAHGSPVAEAPAPSSASAATPKRARKSVSRLAMTKTAKGATLTIHAPGGVTVGMANQLSSGIVHLVIEGASGAPTIERSRPSVAGAKVTRVRRGQGTVQITLELAPGWSLGSVKSFSGGAKVHLKAPV
jgi:hypothetical protein